jgi:Periplasmic binding protein
MKVRTTVYQRPRIGVAATLILTVLLAGGCAGSSLDRYTAAANGTVRIGLIWPQSGAYKTVGDDFAKGWQLYLDAHGGKLGGREVRTTIVDEGDGKQAARTGVKKLIEQDKVSVVIGTISSANAPREGSGAAARRTWGGRWRDAQDPPGVRPVGGIGAAPPSGGRRAEGGR